MARISKSTLLTVCRARMTGLVLAPALFLSACGGNSSPVAQLLNTDTASVAVNPYLWASALDTVSFMPNVQADGTTGVINTDWYANPQSPNERMRMTITITGQELRTDAVQIIAYRQVAQNGVWVDAPVSAATVQKLEGIVLTKARDMNRAAS